VVMLRIAAAAIKKYVVYIGVIMSHNLTT